MRFSLLNIILATSLFLTNTLTSAAAIPQTCVFEGFPCFEQGPLDHCEYCGSWAGRDAVRSGSVYQLLEMDGTVVVFRAQIFCCFNSSSLSTIDFAKLRFDRPSYSWTNRTALELRRNVKATVEKTLENTLISAIRSKGLIAINFGGRLNGNTPAVGDIA
ncbi:hypothetical protein L207DRAFT_572958 [Hyaloscypha variabilis F]|uniref:Uncharacterized protein n=1 Tax=Hyaloscypha variabilis (strain UAMH 11265 / GT02V1 / F) TaxID=1149755 RepID=A0A2J6QYF2_HYAVF|nr:hypothetical protein L207DRAFT_572958 [Hyaloscypha variabilis F]